MRIAVVGAGIAGRMLAWRLSKLGAELGFEISIFDKAARHSQAACSYAAAGILSPLAELEMAEPKVFELGCRSLEIYPQWLSQLSSQVFFKQQGSIVAAHGQDKVELEHFYRLIHRKLDNVADYAQKVDLAIKDQELASLGEGLFLPTEGQLDPIELLQALDRELDTIVWYDNTRVVSIEKGLLKTEHDTHAFDWVFDCRGLGAKESLPLRAVRGELLWLEAPDVNIKNLTRLMHPRYRIYIVPRPNNIYLVGATEIESEDYSPVSVRSSLELLSAAYSVHKGFGEARIIKSVVNCRPALADNLPLMELEDGIGKINGLYRHGILLAPALIEKAIEQLLESIDSKEEVYAVNA
ncbi:FAD-dependent oxidoreductase [Kangiella sp. TOML190]|uniref:FAD-dependent oxidoreductase n=1 Tax=Kangiella sp. TOML190 TaxID=2931351 RepID=UPI00204193BD|nr:FAD-dependent oxidoreductase [Kangiella sp. TOML190]